MYDFLKKPKSEWTWEDWQRYEELTARFAQARPRSPLDEMFREASQRASAPEEPAQTSTGPAEPRASWSHRSPSGRSWKIRFQGLEGIDLRDFAVGWDRAAEEETEMPGPEGKTWAGWKQELAETFRKWNVTTWTLICVLKPAQTARRTQSREERAVAVGFTLRGKLLQVQVRREDRAIDNLALIAKSLEEMRLAEVRGQTDVLLTLYRQLYSEPQRTPPQPAPRVSGPATWPYAYDLLGIQPSAPLEVAEAAYRALAKTAHPDAGGSHAKMQRLNEAIEFVRQEKRR